MAGIATKRRVDPELLLIGETGKRIVTDTTAQTNINAWKILALEATVIASATDESLEAGAYTALPLPAGASIEGVFTAITLTSGKVIVYLR